VRTVADALGYLLTYDYDALDRPAKTTYPDSTFEETVYSRLDPEKQRDRNGRWTYRLHNALGQSTVIRDDVGGTINLSWCTCGSMDKISDSRGNTTTWERDIQGRLTRQVRANGSDVDYVYENTTSRLKQITDARNQTKTFTYTSDNNVSAISYTNAQSPTSNVSFTYDSAYNRQVSMVDGIGTTTFTYHPAGGTGALRLATFNGPLSNDTISYTYDELGRISSRQINGSANSQSYTYDAPGRVTEETNVLGTFTFGYPASDAPLTSITFPNGQTTTIARHGNAGGRRIQDLHHKLSGGATLSRFQYTYDLDGNVLTWSQQRDSGTAQVLTFGYDALDQLASGARTPVDATLVDRFAYAYDKAGNRIAEQLDDTVIGATYDSMNRLTSTQPGGMLRFAGSVNEPATVTIGGNPATVTAGNVFDGRATVPSGTSTVPVVAMDPAGNVRTNNYEVSQAGSSKSFTYDANGNTTGDGTRTYEWDAEDRLVAINEGTHRSEFAYDGLGRRVRMIEKESSVIQTDKRYLWCTLELCEERDSAGTTVTKRYFGNGFQDGSSARFYVRDHLDSVTEVTDSSGTLLARYAYDPFGKRTKLSGASDADFGFTGHFTHNAGPSGSALAMAPHRAYDPYIGRWLSEDPIGMGDGINLYRYVGNVPTTAIDLTGAEATFSWDSDTNGRGCVGITCHESGCCPGGLVDRPPGKPWWPEEHKSAKCYTGQADADADYAKRHKPTWWGGGTSCTQFIKQGNWNGPGTGPPGPTVPPLISGRPSVGGVLTHQYNYCTRRFGPFSTSYYVQTLGNPYPIKPGCPPPGPWTQIFCVVCCK
jgi:RHS repeat-associated protein